MTKLNCWEIAREQAAHDLKTMRSVIFNSILKNKSIEQRGSELMGKKGGKKGNKVSKEKEHNKQKQLAQEKKKGKKN